jgi:hypothetical protein
VCHFRFERIPCLFGRSESFFACDVMASISFDFKTVRDGTVDFQKGKFSEASEYEFSIR